MNSQNHFLKTKLNLIFFLIIAFIFVDVPLQLYKEAYMLAGHAVVYGVLLFTPYSRSFKNYVLHVYMVFIVFSFSVVQGGLTTPVCYFYLSPIMSAHLSFGSRVGKIFTFSVLAIISITFATDLMGLNPFDQLDFASTNIQIFSYAIMTGVGLDVIVTIMNYDKIKNKAIAQLKVKQKEVLQQEEELKQQQQEIIAVQTKEIELEKMKQEQLETDKLKAENSLEAIKSSIEYASKIQLNTLPSQKVLSDYFAEHYIYYKPKDTVGGDYYYVNNFRNTTLIVLIDCYNKGMTGMLLGSVIISYLDTIQVLPTRPSELIYDLHQYVRENFNQYSNINDKGCNLSILYIEDNNLMYSGANGIGYIIKDSGMVKLKSSDRSIGTTTYADNSIPYLDREYALDSDDVIVLSSDGFVKQKDAKGKAVGTEKLEGVIGGFYQGMSKSWEESFEEYISQNFAREQEDDISVLCFNLN